MEPKSNIVEMCHGCTDKIFPLKGTFNISIGNHVKLRFVDENGSELMWVRVKNTLKEKNIYVGTLMNEPVVISSYKFKDIVTFTKEDVFDIIST